MNKETIIYMCCAVLALLLFQYINFRIKEKQHVLSSVLKKHLKKNIENYRDTIPSIPAVNKIVNEYTNIPSTIALFGFHAPSYFSILAVENLILCYFIHNSNYTLESFSHMSDLSVRKFKATYKNKQIFEITICDSQTAVPDHSTFCMGVVVL